MKTTILNLIRDKLKGMKIRFERNKREIVGTIAEIHAFIDVPSRDLKDGTTEALISLKVKDFDRPVPYTFLEDSEVEVIGEPEQDYSSIVEKVSQMNKEEIKKALIKARILMKNGKKLSKKYKEK
jgi:hypothetical protein